MTVTAPPPPPVRLVALDLARTLAVVGMVAFHFTFDLALFGHIPTETLSQPFWYYFARLVAGSFLFLSGISLWLAHGQAIRWRAFGRRFAKLVAAAALVTVASLWLVPGGPIWFGILHALAASSLIGLLVLRLPWPLTLGLAVTVFATAWAYRSPAFDPIWLIWTGLAEFRPLMGDYVPLVPWAAPTLAGIAFARALRVDRWSRRSPTPALRRLAIPGQYSLIIYLAHQPILFGLFNAFAWATQP